MVDVAQLAEQRIVVPLVVGSNPIIHNKRNNMKYKVDIRIRNGNACPKKYNYAFDFDSLQTDSLNEAILFLVKNEVKENEFELYEDKVLIAGHLDTRQGSYLN